MAEYITAAELFRLGVNAKALAALPAGDLTAAIVGASGEIDSALRGAGFTLPLVAYGDEIKEATAVLAAWKALSVRGIRPSENPEDNVLYLEAQRVRDWLKRVADGKFIPSLTDSSTPVAPGVSPGAGLVTSNEQRGYAATDYWSGYVPFQGRRQR